VKQRNSCHFRHTVLTEKDAGKQDLMLERQEQMIDTQKQTNEEIQTLRYDLKTEMNERFNKIEHEIEQVKDALHKHGIMA